LGGGPHENNEKNETFIIQNAWVHSHISHSKKLANIGGLNEKFSQISVEVRKFRVFKVIFSKFVVFSHFSQL
jgi:hypothetical protein